MRNALTVCLVVLSGCADETCDEPGGSEAAPTAADRLLAALQFDGVKAVRQCGKMRMPSSDPPKLLLPSSNGGSGDGTGVIAPGGMVPFMVAWSGGPVVQVDISFGGSRMAQLPLPEGGTTTGLNGLPATVDPDVCRDLDTVCHALRCCMQIVTPHGSYSAPVALQMVLDCTRGAGCPPPYGPPMGSCTPDDDAFDGGLVPPPPDLGRPDLVRNEPVPDLGVRELGPGECEPTCTDPRRYCNESHNCVACLVDEHCPLGQSCRVIDAKNASCVPGCTGNDRCGTNGAGEALACCDRQCSDLSSDCNHCGACGASCVVPHAQSVCTGGRCALGVCDFRWDDCNGDASDGCETNLRIDLANCGACGMKCAFPHAIPACAAACYIAACEFGYEDCNNHPADGCETTPDSDPRNCGGCGVICTQGQSCSNGLCR